MKFDKLLLLLEMPMKLDPIEYEDDPDKVMKSRYISYKKVGTFQAFDKFLDVYITDILKTGPNNVLYNINYFDKTVASYSGMEINGGIISNVIKSFGKKYNLKGLMFYFYINFLLRKYRFVLSDDGLTQEGFNFWYNNFDRFSSDGYQIGIAEYKNKQIIDIKKLINREELKQYYGYMIKNPLAGLYRFKVYK